LTKGNFCFFFIYYCWW